jgi:hypothetical protein
MELDPGIETSLLAKLDATIEALQSTRMWKYYSSVIRLRGFKIRVLLEAKWKRIPWDQAVQLRRMAQEIIGVIRGTSAETVGTDGGTVSGTGELSEASVEIPPESLETETLITVNENSTPPMMPTNFEDAGPAVDFGPEGTVFESDVTIKIPYNPTIPVENLELLTFDKAIDLWRALDSWIETEGDVNLICARVNHFSTFQAGEQGPDPDAPYFEGIALWNRNQPDGHYLFMVVHVVDPNGSFPDSFQEVSVSGPDIPGGTYTFGPKDYIFDIQTGQEFYFLNVFLGDSPPSGGTYTFYAKVDEEDKDVTEEKDLAVETIGFVDAATITPGDKSIVLTNPSFSWDPVSYGGTVYYRVSIDNWRGQTIYRSTRSTATSLDFPEGILRDNSAYRFRVEAFDEANGWEVSNASRCQRLMIGTGDLNFDTSAILNGVAYTFNCLYTNPPGTSLMLAVTVRQGLGGPILGPEDIEGGQIAIRDPNGTDVSLYSTDYIYWAEQFYKTIPMTEFSAGEYVFTVTDTSGNTTNYGDYLNRVKILPIATQLSPIDKSVRTHPTFSWEPVPGAVMYWVAIDDEWRNRVHSSPRVTETQYTLDVPNILRPGGNYRWNVRAHDGIDASRIDNRSNTNYSWFSVDADAWSSVNNYSDNIQNHPWRLDGHYFALSLTINDATLFDSVQSFSAKNLDPEKDPLIYTDFWKAGSTTTKWSVFYNLGMNAPYTDQEGKYEIDLTYADDSDEKLYTEYLEKRATPVPIPQNLTVDTSVPLEPILSFDPIDDDTIERYRLRIYSGNYPDEIIYGVDIPYGESPIATYPDGNTNGTLNLQSGENYWFRAEAHDIDGASWTMHRGVNFLEFTVP